MTPYSALRHFDARIIQFIRAISSPLGRASLFVVFFWFGILKIIYVSPANTLVEALLVQSLPFIPFDTFIVFLGLYEMLIGISFLIPGLERLAIALLIPHMIATFLPLILLTHITWNAFFVPTLEGQYIVKNLVIFSLALGIAAHLHPLTFNKRST